MGRKSRELSEAGLYHVIVRGNNKHRLFHGKSDFEKFLGLMKENRGKHPVKILHYCLMSNHVHMLLGADEFEVISKFMHGVQRSYHHYYRKTYTWFGHLFQGRFKSLAIQSEGYLLECGRYIERNPVRAKMVERPGEWKYSSYGVYASGEKDEMVTRSVAYEGLANQDGERRRIYRERVEITRPYEDIIDRELVGMK